MEVALEILNSLDLVDLYRLGFITLVVLVGFALTDWGSLGEDEGDAK